MRFAFTCRVPVSDEINEKPEFVLLVMEVLRVAQNRQDRRCVKCRRALLFVATYCGRQEFAEKNSLPCGAGDMCQADCVL